MSSDLTIPTIIKRGMRFTTSWASDKRYAWLLTDIVDNIAFLVNRNGERFTTKVNELRVPYNADYTLYHRDKDKIGTWRVIESKRGIWHSGTNLIADKIKELEAIKYADQAKEFVKNNPITFNQSNMKLETTKEKVLEAASKCPQAKTVLETMFPDVFEDNTIFCEIGAIFFRKKYPNNMYAVVKHGGKVIAMNITNSSKWNEDKAIMLINLKDWNCLSITVSEFRKLTGYKNLDEFTVVPKSFNSVLGKFVELNKHKL